MRYQRGCAGNAPRLPQWPRNLTEKGKSEQSPAGGQEEMGQAWVEKSQESTLRQLEGPRKVRDEERGRSEWAARRK